MNQEFIELVLNAAKARGEEISVPEEFIAKALQKIEAGEAEVARYPNGSPSLKDVFDLAVQLWAETNAKQGT